MPEITVDVTRTGMDPWHFAEVVRRFAALRDLQPLASVKACYVAASILAAAEAAGVVDEPRYGEVTLGGGICLEWGMTARAAHVTLDGNGHTEIQRFDGVSWYADLFDARPERIAKLKAWLLRGEW